MYTSYIINKPYKYEIHNLLDLKKKILADHNFSRLDIVNGYHQKDSYNLEYDYSDLDKTFSDEDVKKLREIYDKSLAELVRMFNASYERKVQRCAELESEIQKKLPDFTFHGLEEFSRIAYRSHTVREYCRLELRYTDDVSDIVEKVEDFRKYFNAHCELDEKYLPYSSGRVIVTKPDMFNAIFAYNLHEEGLSDKFYVSLNRPYLPTRFRPNEGFFLESDDFVIEGVWVKLECEDTNLLKRFRVNSYLPYRETLYDTDLRICIFKLFHNAQKYYDSAIEKAIDEVSFDDNTFNVMVESMPIVINRNSKTNKVELIDGYKRLLVNNNKEQLDIDIPVKVFEDLSDIDFLKLLFSLNEWKLFAREDFYDRGFLFALREHFGIRQEDYPTTNTRYDKLDSFNMSLLNILRLYGEDSAKVPNQYADDILQLKNILALHEETTVIKNDMFKDKLFKALIELLGAVRRENCSSEKVDVIGAFRNVINNSQLVEMLNKKAKIKMNAWVNNFWLENHVDNLLKELLKKELNIVE